MIQSPVEYMEASLIRQYFSCLFAQTEMFKKGKSYQGFNRLTLVCYPEKYLKTGPWGAYQLVLVLAILINASARL